MAIVFCGDVEVRVVQVDDVKVRCKVISVPQREGNNNSNRRVKGSEFTVQQ
jgi:hypothetical protein